MTKIPRGKHDERGTMFSTLWLFLALDGHCEETRVSEGLTSDDQLESGPMKL
jgi:hypothetical protein